MKEFILLRHGATQGNREGRYVGATDEPLSPEGRAALAGCAPPPADRLYVSPLRRCRESAALLYPDLEPIPVEGFRECRFGEFEYKNHQELSADPRYQAWIDSGGLLPFPGGEDRDAFCARCRAAFQALLDGPWEGRAALVVHGGTIMAILSGFAHPRRDYFDYQVKNGRGYFCRQAGGGLALLNEL